MKTTQNEQDDSNWGMMIFKDTFEYLIDGDMSNDEFCTLMMCIYNLREYGEMPNERELSKTVRVAWKTLKHSILKSARNKRYYDNNKTNTKKTIKKTSKEEPNDCYYCPWTENDDVNKDIERGIDNIIKNATYNISTDNQEFMDRLSNLKLDMMLKYNINEEEARNMVITSFNEKAIENSVNENTFSVDTNDKVELGC